MVRIGTFRLWQKIGFKYKLLERFRRSVTMHQMRVQYQDLLEETVAHQESLRENVKHRAFSADKRHALEGFLCQR